MESKATNQIRDNAALIINLPRLGSAGILEGMEASPFCSPVCCSAEQINRPRSKPALRWRNLSSKPGNSLTLPFCRLKGRLTNAPCSWPFPYHILFHELFTLNHSGKLVHPRSPLGLLLSKENMKLGSVAVSSGLLICWIALISGVSCGSRTIVFAFLQEGAVKVL